MNTINAPEMRGAKESTHSLFTRWLQSKRDMAVAIAVLTGLFAVALSVAYVDEPTAAQAHAMVAGLGRK